MIEERNDDLCDLSGVNNWHITNEEKKLARKCTGLLKEKNKLYYDTNDPSFTSIPIFVNVAQIRRLFMSNFCTWITSENLYFNHDKRKNHNRLLPGIFGFLIV